MSTHLKRHRTPSQTSSLIVDTHNPPKTPRTLADETGSSTSSYPILCTLPPTCNREPVALTSTRDLEVHYSKYHACVCEYGRCGTVFPDPRLLELHQTECHDPLAAARKERGEKIFACHLSDCAKLFSTPKGRRLHLIQVHGYPKEYFFAVTNKGIGGLLKRWGEGVSLIRKPWKARNENDGNDCDGIGDTNEVIDKECTNRGVQPLRSTRNDNKDALRADTNGLDIVDKLADDLHSLSIVPTSVRFGRGARKGGSSTNVRQSNLSTNLRGGGGGKRSHSTSTSTSDDSTLINLS